MTKQKIIEAKLTFFFYGSNSHFQRTRRGPRGRFPTHRSRDSSYLYLGSASRSSFPIRLQSSSRSQQTRPRFREQSTGLTARESWQARKRAPRRVQIPHLPLFVRNFTTGHPRTSRPLPGKSKRSLGRTYPHRRVVPRITREDRKADSRTSRT